MVIWYGNTVQYGNTEIWKYFYISKISKHITNEFIKLSKEYNFKKNSVRKFANEYKISEKTVTKYLKQNNIDYNSRTLLIYKSRDVNGRFCLSIERVKRFDSNKSNLISKEVKDNKLKTIEKIKINPSKNQNLSEKSYQEKLRRIMTPFK